MSMSQEKKSELGSLCLKLLLSACVGTVVLLAMADNPWDGDELVKGPFTGLIAYGGGDIKAIYELIRKA